MKKTKSKKANLDQAPKQSQSTPKILKTGGKEVTPRESLWANLICKDYGYLSVMS